MSEPRSCVLPRVVVVASLIVCLLTVVTELSVRDFGFGERLGPRGRIVDEVDAGSGAADAGLAKGDRIVRDPSGASWNASWSERDVFRSMTVLGAALRSGHAEFVVERDGIERTLAIVAHGPRTPCTLRQLRRIAPLLSSATGFLGLAALLAFASSASSRPRRLVIYAFAAFAPALTTNWPTPGWPPWLLHLYALSNLPALALVLLAAFTWSFPRELAMGRNRTLQVAGLAAAILAMLVSTLDTFGIIRAPLAGNRTAVMFDVVMLVVLCVGLVLQMRVAAGVVERRQLRMLLAGFLLGGVVPAVWIIAVYAQGFASPLQRNAAFQLTALIPLSVALAVARYRLFDFDARVARLSVDGLLVLLSVIGYLVVSVATTVLLGGIAASHDLPRWTGLATVILLGVPLRRVAEDAVDRLFARDRQGTLERCAVAGALLANEVSDECETVRSALGLDRVWRLDPDQTLAAQLRRDGAIRTVELAPPALVDQLLAERVDALMYVPPKIAGEPSSALALSGQLAQAALGAEERHALGRVGEAVSRMRAQRDRRSTLERRVANADDARAQIAMELHDGVGATLTAAQLLTQLMGRDEHAPTAGSIALLERTLRDGLVDLRLALFSMDDDAAGWDDVFARLRRHVGDVCETAGLRHHFTARGESLTTPTAAVRLALFRVTQEALINVVRHARAANVVFDVAIGCGHVAITIEDDGAGMSDAPRDCDGADHRGIRNMRRRVERLGGALAFEQPTERGTRLRMTLPSH